MFAKGFSHTSITFSTNDINHTMLLFGKSHVKIKKTTEHIKNTSLDQFGIFISNKYNIDCKSVHKIYIVTLLYF